MVTPINITFHITPSQMQTITSRAHENGFDDVASYIKVVALKTQSFTFKPMPLDNEEASIELSFKVTPSQEAQIQENLKSSECKDLPTYLSYVALNGVISAVIEIRSTGSLDEMLARIGKSRNLDL